jgi:hypothetical protein
MIIPALWWWLGPPSGAPPATDVVGSVTLTATAVSTTLDAAALGTVTLEVDH